MKSKAYIYALSGYDMGGRFLQQICMTCLHCNGTGEEKKAWEDEIYLCPHCRGNGKTLLKTKKTINR